MKEPFKRERKTASISGKKTGKRRKEREGEKDPMSAVR